MPTPDSYIDHPWVFLSYAHEDSSRAEEIRDRLQKEGIKVWQDVTHLDAGVMLYNQIDKVISQVNHLLVLITPASLHSQWVKDEMHLARRRGICLVPVVADEVTGEELPGWLAKQSCQRLQSDHDWSRLVTQLRQRCQAPRYVNMAPTLQGEFVARPNEFNRLKSILLAEGDTTVAISTALVGAGGFGKTWLATTLCHDEEVMDRYSDGILWITLGEKPTSQEIQAKVGELLFALTGNAKTAGPDAARSKLKDLLDKRNILLVVDDAWREEDVQPFLQGGEGTVRRLITTRNLDVLGTHSQRVNVDGMDGEEAFTLLSKGLEIPPQQKTRLVDLAKRLGRWPLLLSLVNGQLRKSQERHMPLPQSVALVEKTLQRDGVKGFDVRHAQAREHLASLCLELSMNLLEEEEKGLFADLAIFPEDIPIPLPTIYRLWQVRQAWSEEEGVELLQRLADYSLLQYLDFANSTARLHDIIRTHLRHLQKAELPHVHGQFLDSFQVDNWSDLPLAETYLWNHLQWHLQEAGRAQQWLACLYHLPFLAAKCMALQGGWRVVDDLLAGVAAYPQDERLALILRRFRPLSHRMAEFEHVAEAMDFLSIYLDHLPEKALLLPKKNSPSFPHLQPLHPLPDLPNPALMLVFSGHGSLVSCCAISPDGERVLSGSWDSTLRLWSIKTGQTLLTLQGHSGDITNCAISPDGRLAVSSSIDNTVRIWSLEDGKTRFVLEGHTKRVKDCAFSPDGQKVASVSNDETLRVWSVASGKVERIIEEGINLPNCCAFSPDGKTIHVGGSGLKSWSLNDGQPMEELLAGFTTDFSFNSDGSRMVSTSWSNTMELWSWPDRKLLHTLTGHSDIVRCFSFSHNNQYIASGSQDNTLRLWDVATGQCLRVFAGHKGSVYSCAFTADDSFILSASYDDTLRLWSTHEIQQLTISQQHQNIVSSCNFSPDGQRLVTGSFDDTLRTWQIASGQPEQIFHGHGNTVNQALFSPNGQTILSASGDKTVRLWSAEGGECMMTLEGHSGGGNACAYSPDGKSFLSVSPDKTLGLWSASDGQLLRLLQGHGEGVYCCAFSLDGKTVVSGSDDCTLRLWSVDNGETLKVLQGHSGRVTRCIFSPNGTTLLSSSSDETLHLWSVNTGQIERAFSGHNGHVKGCAFFPDGKRFVSVSFDKTIRLWDVQSGCCLHVFPVMNKLWDCAVSPDGRLVAACGDGGVYFLKVVENGLQAGAE